MMQIDWSNPNDNKNRHNSHQRQRAQSQSAVRSIWSSITHAFGASNGSTAPSRHSSQRSSKPSTSSHHSRPAPNRSGSKSSTYQQTTYPPGTIIVVHGRRPSAPRVQVVAPPPTPQRQGSGYTQRGTTTSMPSTPARRPSHPQRFPTGSRTEGGTKVIGDEEIIREYMTSRNNVEKWIRSQAARGY